MITFYKHISKEQKEKRKILTQKSYEDILKKLKTLINKEEPKLVKVLGSMWDHQANSISYSELGEAIKKGAIDEKIIKLWREEYARFVNEVLALKWKSAMLAATEEITNRHDNYLFNPDHKIVLEWVEKHTGELITQVSEEQVKAINNMVQRSMEYSNDNTVDSLAMAIRPTIGLTAPQTAANLNYYHTIRLNLIENYPKMRMATAEKRARERALIYAKKQHRSRAMTIARTELATAYNMGTHLGIKQAQEQGFMGKTVKRSVSALDERVCSECKRLHGTEVGEDDFFATKWGEKLVPPFHPNCRDAVEYVEIEEKE